MKITGIDSAFKEYMSQGINKYIDGKRLLIDCKTLTMVCDKAGDNNRFRPLSDTEVDVLNFAFNRHENLKLSDITVPVLSALTIEAINASTEHHK